LKISFITFGGRCIGTGHLFRCLAISKWLKNTIKADISFYLVRSSEDNQNIAANIIRERSSYNVTIISDNSIDKVCSNIAIVDNLDTSYSIMKELRGNVDTLVSIDNTSESRVLADITINPLYYNLKDPSYVRKKNEYIGPKYQIISPEYFQFKNKHNSYVKNILIIQGGSDPFGITYKIVKDIESLLLVNSNIVINVVSGPASKDVSLFSSVSKRYKNRIIFHRNIINMSNFLRNIDLAISSVGVVAFEVSSLGIPSIYVTGVNKEVETGRAMEKLGVGICLGLYKKIPPNEIYNSLYNLIENSDLRNEIRCNCLNVFNKNNIEKMIEIINNKGGG
jgi:spore coat polysaccharide biosynthesis predicted glycosyltransferase SpsG